MNALIVCCSSKQIGIGHLSRSKILLDLLKKNLGWNLKILLIGNTNKNYSLNNSDIINLEPNKDVEAYIESQNFFFDVIFFDFHPLVIPKNLREFLIKLKNKNIKLVAIDCLINFRKFLDLIIIPSFYLEEFFLEDGCPILYGWEYLIVNPKICKKSWKQGNRALILSGGSDVKNLGSTLPKYLNDRLPKNTIIDWVTGPYSSKPNFNNCKRIKIIEHNAPENLTDIIKNANFAITLYGITFFELLYAGIPTVVFSGIKNKDNKQIEIIKKKKIALVADDQYGATDLLCSLLKNDKLSKSLHLNSQKYIGLMNNSKLIKEIQKIL